MGARPINFVGEGPRWTAIRRRWDQGVWYSLRALAEVVRREGGRPQAEFGLAEGEALAARLDEKYRLTRYRSARLAAEALRAALRGEASNFVKDKPPEWLARWVLVRDVRSTRMRIGGKTK